MKDLNKTYNVSGIPHTDSENNIKAWHACETGVIERTGFQVLAALEKLYTERNIVQTKIETLVVFIETAKPMSENNG
jgi:hypothetical protein